MNLVNFFKQKIDLIIQSASPTLWVAYSGGVDSTVLLDLLLNLKKIGFNPVVKAIHVNHGLQPAAIEFERHCLDYLAQQKLKFNFNFDFDFEFKVVAAVDAVGPIKKGESLEAYAREARYEIFKSQLKPGDFILTAQHEADQIETFFVQLMRGSGVEGLSAMPELKPLGEGFLWRPLLEVPKLAILNYAQEKNLSWIEDPSNKDCQRDRNFWRHQIIPQLLNKYPGFFKTMTRTIRHCQDASGCLDQWGEDLFKKNGFVLNQPLSWEKLNCLNKLNQKLILRIWLKYWNLNLSETQLDEVLFQKNLIFKSKGQCYALRSFQKKLYFLMPEEINYLNIKHLEPYEISWDGRTDLTLPHWPYLIPKEKWPMFFLTSNSNSNFNFNLNFMPNDLVIKNRQGGERLWVKEAAHGFHKDLKLLFQSLGIPPWWRARVPLVYAQGKLVGIIWE